MKRLIILLLLFVALVGCGEKKVEYRPIKDLLNVEKPRAYGGHQDVYVFSNQEISVDVMTRLKKEFGNIIPGIQNEKAFFLQWKTFDGFDDLKKARNIIFICDLSIEDELTAFVLQKLPEEKINYVLDYSSIIVSYENEWADDQLISFVVSRDKERTDDILLVKAPNLYLDYQKRFLKRMTRRVYYRSTLSANEFIDLPFGLKIPDSYQLYKRDDVEDMISFIYRFKKGETVLPDKFVSVYHEKIEQRDFEEFWVKKSREKLGKTILDGDEIIWDRTQIMPKTLSAWDHAVYQGYIIEGAWKNETTDTGGSFKSYAIYHQKSGTAYLIDTAVYYPAGTKIPYLLEMEGIAKSFYIKE